MAKHRRRLLECPNCATDLPGNANFCPSCGQENHELKVRFGVLWRDFFDNVLQLHSRSLRTVGQVLWRPGFVAQKFVAGRRASYVPPVRFAAFTLALALLLMRCSVELDLEDGKFKAAMAARVDPTTRLQEEIRIKYKQLQREGVAVSKEELSHAKALEVSLSELFAKKASTALFAAIAKPALELDTATEILASSAAQKDVELVTEPGGQTRLRLNGEPSSVRFFNFTIELDAETLANYSRDPKGTVENLLEKQGMTTGSLKGELVSRLISRGIELELASPDQVARIGRDVSFSLFEHSMLIVFLTLPFLLLALWLIYIRQKRFFYEHVIFLLYNGSAFFLTVALLKALELLGVTTLFIVLPLALWMVLYQILAMKRFYEQGWICTLAKAAVLGLIGLTFSAVLVVGFTLWAVISG